MRSRTTLCTATLVVAAAVLGWLAGSGRLDTSVKAEPGPSPASAESGSSNERSAKCCDAAMSRDAYVVRGDLPGAVAGAAKKQDGKKPNILIIWGDDIGWFNPSCYHGGLMGYRTPNIDRIAREGARFTDWYGQQSCTAGRDRKSTRLNSSH